MCCKKVAEDGIICCICYLRLMELLRHDLMNLLQTASGSVKLAFSGSRQAKLKFQEMGTQQSRLMLEAASIGNVEQLSPTPEPRFCQQYR